MCRLFSMQVSVLTDQVEAQGEKIRDLDLCLDEHREKLNATEEMLQQVFLCLLFLYNDMGEVVYTPEPPNSESHKWSYGAHMSGWHRLSTGRN